MRTSTTLADYGTGNHRLIVEPNTEIEKKYQVPEDFVSRVKWNVKVDGFQGALDLLLFLIREQQMDIFTVNLTELTEGYLEYIQIQNTLDLELAGDFILIASVLIQFKTRALLPTPLPEEEESEEDDAQLILQRLEEYKRFKELASRLRGKEKEREAVFTRPRKAEEAAEAEALVFYDVDVYDLYSAFRKVLSEVGRDRSYTLSPEEYTVDEKMAELIFLMRDRENMNLLDYLKEMNSKIEIIVTFLALLECLKRRSLTVKQSSSRGEIWIFRGKDWQHAAERT